MTTKQQELKPQQVSDMLWTTAAANASGLIGTVYGEPIPLNTALMMVMAARGATLAAGNQFDDVRILTLKGRGGDVLLYVRPNAPVWDPRRDPWS